jgi:exodeoxyribonuclease V beta subunit
VGDRARAFGEGGRTLVLIADPKQAIYAFRGADVYAYLEAAHGAGTRATLRVNRRSDQALIDAFDALFGGARLGHEGIVYRRVGPPPATASRAARPDGGGGLGGTGFAALRVRVLDRSQPTMSS